MKSIFRFRMAPLSLAALGLGALGGCSNAGGDLGFEPVGSGTVAAFFYVDRNGDLLPTPSADTTYAGVRFGLVLAGTNDTAFSETTDALGNVVFRNVPFGDYRFVVDSASVDDSLQIQDIDSATVRLRGGTPQQLVTVRLGFPQLSVAQARAASVGSKVFIRGMMLTGVTTFGDTTAHIIEDGIAIRLSNASAGGPAVQEGDSARVLGTVSLRAGQPVLDNAVITVYRFSVAAPSPTPLSTLLAGNADTTAQDAALVGIAGAVILDTVTVGADFHVGVDDGTGRVVMVLDGDGNFQLSLVAIGKLVTATGVLVPTGSGSWVLKPRNQADLTIT
jgi:hypothetical protein